MALFITQLSYGYPVSPKNDNCVVTWDKWIIVKPHKPDDYRTLLLEIKNPDTVDLIVKWELLSGEKENVTISKKDKKIIEVPTSAFGPYRLYLCGKENEEYVIHDVTDDLAPAVDIITSTVSKTNELTVEFLASDAGGLDYANASNKAQIESATINVKCKDGSDDQSKKTDKDYCIEKFSLKKPNAEYVITVTATDYAGNSKKAEKTVVTSPAKPSVSNISTTVETATLSWNSVSGATRYNIYNGTTQIGYVDAPKTSYTIGNLIPGTTYETYRVTAYNGNTKKESDYSPKKSFTTQKFIISNRKAVPSYESVVLSWDTHPKATKYYIYDSQGTLLATYSAPNPQAWVNSLNYTVKNLEPGKNYKDFYIIAENGTKYKSKKEDGLFPTFTTMGFVISGPDRLCTKASYAIINYNPSLFSISKWSCSTATVKATNGNGYSIELKKVADGEGWISFTLKSKSTNKEYTIRKRFSVGLYGAPSSVNVPKYNLNRGTTYTASVKGGTSGFTYTWSIEQSSITSGQGTGSISFIINGTGGSLPSRAEKNQGESLEKDLRSTRKMALQPNPSIPTQPLVLSGNVIASNSCGSKKIYFTVTYNQPQPNMKRSLPDSVEAIAFAEEVLSSIEEGTVSEEKSFVVYPNPANSIINVSHPFEKETINSIDIFDVSGAKHISKSYTGENHSTTVDISSLPNGKYILIVNQNGSAQAGTFIKQ